MTKLEPGKSQPEQLDQAHVTQTALQQSFEHSPLPQFLMRGPSHVMQAVNAAGRALIPSRSLLGLTMEEALGDKLSGRAVSRHDAVFATGQTTFFRASPRHILDDVGTETLQYFDIYLTRWLLPDGAPGGVLATCVNVSNFFGRLPPQDVSAASAQALEEANEDARVAFTDGLAHDLRGPLTAVRLTLESICNAHAPEEKRKCCRSLRALQRADNLIENFLDASLVHAGKAMVTHCAPVDLVPPLRGVLRDCRDTFATPVRFVHDASLRGTFDVQLVSRALQNLVHNAMVHGTYGEPIEVSLHSRSLGKEACLQVKNVGADIPLVEQGQILARFGRGSRATARALPGWGLGLSVVQAVADAHGGELSLASAQGTTTFTLTLPTAGPEAGMPPGATLQQLLHPPAAKAPPGAHRAGAAAAAAQAPLPPSASLQ